MTTISAKVIADSTTRAGKRITTMQLRYPRFIHAEFMTHRQLSRNASSSRAIPVERIIEDIRRDPAMPLHWGKNQAGMQAHQQTNDLVQMRDGVTGEPWTMEREEAWLAAMENAINIAEGFHRAGYHKQVINRLLEPFSHINVVVTATEWSNFYKLRIHEDAEPHIQILASAMKQAQDASLTRILDEGEWHVPYVENGWWGPGSGLTLNQAIAASVARCARVSYMTHDGREPDLDLDIALYHRLVGSIPLHASPAEHQATPRTTFSAKDTIGNFKGWDQYRKFLPDECG